MDIDPEDTQITVLMTATPFQGFSEENRMQSGESIFESVYTSGLYKSRKKFFFDWSLPDRLLLTWT